MDALVAGGLSKASNSNERFISPRELRVLLESFKNYHVITGEGKGHKYAAEAVAEAVRQHLRR